MVVLKCIMEFLGLVFANHLGKWVNLTSGLDIKFYTWLL